MKRRSFLTGAVATGAMAGTAHLGAPAFAQGKRRLKMVTTWPKNFPGLGTGAQRLARRITEASDGTLDVRVFAGGELVPALSAFDAVSSGAADMYHGAEYYWQGKSKAYNFFSAAPFGLTASEIAAWIYFGGGQELWDELSAKFNIKPFMGGNTGVQMGGWFKKEITSLEDFKGLKIRIPGLGGEVYRRLGAATVTYPGGEIFQALQTGAIDAADWVGPWNDLAFGFYKIAKFYYYPGFHEPGASLGSGINLEVWDSFSKSQKALIQSAMAAENDMMRAEFNARNAAALDVLVTRHQVKMRRFSDEIVAALRRVSDEVVAEAGQEDELSRRIHDSYMKFRKESITWQQYSERAYSDIRRAES
ncbi:MAG: TRAP transporter substrate-binding protein [Sphingomonadales bacterium]